MPLSTSTVNSASTPRRRPCATSYQDGRLAIIHAVGMSDTVNRSHFDAMQYVELGTPGILSTQTGWLTRHLQSASNLPSQLTMPSLAVGDLQPTSLRGDLETLSMNDPGSFSLDNGPWLWRGAQRTALRQMYEGSSSWLHGAGVQTLNAVDIIELNVADTYTPANGATYPNGSFGDHLQVLAQMIKLDLGLQVATLDLGGWDTHDAQGNDGGGYFATLAGELAQGLMALYTDLDGSGANNYTQRLTVVVQSEFGREVRENADGGTEHGYGNQMFVLSGNAIGGFHGSWPGIAPGALTDGTDLSVTTDYRRVLSEILIRRMCNPMLGTIFPGYTDYSPLGIVQGTDLTPVFGGPIFNDGFESGSTSAWTTITS